MLQGVLTRGPLQHGFCGDGADINTDSYDTVNTGTDVSVPGTAGYLDSIAITLSNIDSAE